MKTINLVCYGGPCDGELIEIIWNKVQWTSPQHELYKVRRVYVSGQGYKKLLVWHRIEWDLVDMEVIGSLLKESTE